MLVEIARRKAAGESVFEVKSRGMVYQVDLTQMTQTNLSSGRTRTIRVVDSLAAPPDPGLGLGPYEKV